MGTLLKISFWFLAQETCSQMKVLKYALYNFCIWFRIQYFIKCSICLITYVMRFDILDLSSYALCLIHRIFKFILNWLFSFNPWSVFHKDNAYWDFYFWSYWITYFSLKRIGIECYIENSYHLIPCNLWNLVDLKLLKS